MARRAGAAECMGRAVQVRDLVVPRLAPPGLRTIAMLDSPIGLQGGVCQRRLGAARMPARVAHLQLEVVLESWETQ